MKKIAWVSILLINLICLTSCGTGFDSYRETIGNYRFTYGVGTTRKKMYAFLGSISFQYDGEVELIIKIPDTVKGLPVTELGGHYDLGVRAPFKINTPTFKVNDPEEFYSRYPEFSEYEQEDLVFQIHIGKNLKKLTLGWVSGTYGNLYTGYEKIFVINYYFICDESNKTFYSKDGILYNRNDNKEAQFERTVGSY
mgnify:CR=1 FL=1